MDRLWSGSSFLSPERFEKTFKKGYINKNRMKGRTAFVKRGSFLGIVCRIMLLSAAVCAPAISAHAENMPPHPVQTVTEQDIYEGMRALGYLETPVLDGADCGRAYENVKNCIVRIQMGRAHGSGIVWELSDERIVIATNRHVLDYWKAEDGYVHFPQGYDADAGILGVSEQFDVGFLAVDCGLFTYEELQTMRCARSDAEAAQEMDPGDALFLVDAGAMDAEEQYYEGTIEDAYRYIEDLDAYMVYGRCYAKAGMSGGGTFDAEGRLIGMTTAGTIEDEFASVPVRHIMAAYEEITDENG